MHACASSKCPPHLDSKSIGVLLPDQLHITPHHGAVLLPDQLHITPLLVLMPSGEQYSRPVGRQRVELSVLHHNR
jgi:hypothetical protein